MSERREAVRAWAPKKPKWPWRDFLTDGEREAVEAAETISRDAKAMLRSATVLLNGYRNRAIQRAKYAAARPQESDSER